MEKMTVTEALAETKLIEKKVAKSREIVAQHCIRFSHIGDPFDAKGGAKEILKREIQSAQDNGERLVRIRTAIANANLKTSLRIGDSERSVTAWLAWRKEVAPMAKNALVQLAGRVTQEAKKAEQNPPAYKDENGKVKLSEIVYNVDLEEVNAKAQAIEDVLGALDGKLSLLNATTVVEF